jgi:hypothetical protein
MASGHVNRTNRPNTWLHRPSLQREDSSCQLGAVHTWHKADIQFAATNVRFLIKRTFVRSGSGIPSKLHCEFARAVEA